MARSRDQQPPAESATEAAALGIHAFTEPDDQGISLDELSQAYAALLGKGADPYSDAAPENQPARRSEIAASGLVARESSRDDDAAFEITPRSILEAILFVGHPTGEPLTSERIAGLMRGVRPAEIDDLVAELNAEYQRRWRPLHHRLRRRRAINSSCGPNSPLCVTAFYGRIREARLSQAAVDILAIIAYHQPVTAELIDRLRGKPSGAILSNCFAATSSPWSGPPRPSRSPPIEPPPVSSKSSA